MKFRRSSTLSNTKRPSIQSTRDSYIHVQNHLSQSTPLSNPQTKPQQYISPPSLSFYFNTLERQKYVTKCIDHYFHRNQQQIAKDKSSYIDKSQSNTIMLNNTSEYQNTIFLQTLSPIKRQSLSKSFIIPQEKEQLPIIEENIGKESRPRSEQKKRLSFRKSQYQHVFQLKQSQLFQSTKSNIKSNQIYQNNFYSVHKNIQNNTILKTYKPYGIQMLKRQLKIQKLYSIPTMWTKNSEDTIERKKLKCLREELYKIVQQKNGDENLFIIYPNQQYSKLFVNGNEWLVDIIVGICKQFVSLKNNVIHPRININSIYRKQEKEIFIDEWGCSGFKQIINGKQNKLINNVNPLISSKGEWFVQPQYLSPQMLRDMDNNFKTFEMWDNPTTSNMWQLGCVIFQILTLVPLWLPYKCCIKGQQKIRKGALSSKIRLPSEILKIQKRFTINFRRLALKDRHLGTSEINQKIIRVMQMMLKVNAQERITPQQVIKILTL